MRGSYTGSGKGKASNPAKETRVAEQKQVLQALQGGRGVQLYSANPLVAGVERLGNIFAGTQQPTAYAAKLGGREVLQVPGGWNPASNPANVNVGGRTWDLAQSGKDAVYIPRTTGTLASASNVPAADDSSVLRTVIEDRNYQAEKARAAQLAEQDQLSKKYQVADLTKAYNTAKTPEEKEKLGLQIWATTNPQLAAKLKPGQLGYTEAVTAFQAQSPFGSIAKAAGDMQFADKLSADAFTKTPELLQGINPYSVQLETPLTGVSFSAPSQVGVSETFKSMTPIPGTMEAFTDPLKLLKPDLTQTQQALLKQAFNQALK